MFIDPDKRIVNSEERLSRWRDIVLDRAPIGDSPKSTFILLVMSSPDVYDRDAWVAKYRAKHLMEATGLKHGTFYNHVGTALQSSMVEEVGTFEYETGRGTEEGPAYQLVYRKE